ncbi:hypothetical protein L2E82_12430 [Cichorium intybus]|uniref:Uncharacterized protein n=1 Tax=Cichorium intybus TaxID=13427 RepID=A0ACB9GG17_CICIN|nr:hypothetical protein L2E82_12430 [Cichorium intybus]
MGLQTTENGSKEGGSSYGLGRSEADVAWSQPKQKSQIRNKTPVVFLPVQREDGTYTGERAIAGDRRCTGEGAIAGDWMRKDESSKVGDNPVGNTGDFFFCSNNHVPKEELLIKMII